MSKPEHNVSPSKPTSIWKHPYALYIVLTAVIFAAMVLIAWFALESGILPRV